MKPKLNELNEHVICQLCSGYMIDASTLTDCLHSFCRSCILRYLPTSSADPDLGKCPVCEQAVNMLQIDRCLRSDYALQDLIYKLVPGLYREELDRRREFYRNQCQKQCQLRGPFASPKNLASEKGQLRQRIFDRHLVELAAFICTPEESVSLCLQYMTPQAEKRLHENVRQSYRDAAVLKSNNVPLNAAVNTNPENIVKEPSEPTNRTTRNSAASSTVKTEKAEPSDDLSTFDGQQQAIDKIAFKRYFRCAAAVCVHHLRKLLHTKLELPSNFQLEMRYKEEVLEDDYSLMDIAYIYNWRRDTPMQLQFSIYQLTEVEDEEDEQMPTLEAMPVLCDMADSQTLDVGKDTITNMDTTNVPVSSQPATKKIEPVNQPPVPEKKKRKRNKKPSTVSLDGATKTTTTFDSGALDDTIASVMAMGTEPLPPDPSTFMDTTPGDALPTSNKQCSKLEPVVPSTTNAAAIIDNSTPMDQSKAVDPASNNGDTSFDINEPPPKKIRTTSTIEVPTLKVEQQDVKPQSTPETSVPIVCSTSAPHFTSPPTQSNILKTALTSSGPSRPINQHQNIVPKNLSNSDHNKKTSPPVHRSQQHPQSRAKEPERSQAKAHSNPNPNRVNHNTEHNKASTSGASSSHHAPPSSSLWPQQLQQQQQQSQPHHQNHQPQNHHQQAHMSSVPLMSNMLMSDNNPAAPPMPFDYQQQLLQQQQLMALAQQTFAYVAMQGLQQQQQQQHNRHNNHNQPNPSNNIWNAQNMMQMMPRMMGFGNNPPNFNNMNFANPNPNHNNNNAPGNNNNNNHNNNHRSGR